MVHGSANHLSELLHNLGRKEHPPVPPDELRREAPTSERRHQADLTGLELAGHPLGGAQRHLAAYLGVALSTINSWNSSGYGPPFVKLGNLVRYTYEDVEIWLARQLELSRG